MCFVLGMVMCVGLVAVPVYAETPAQEADAETTTFRGMVYLYEDGNLVEPRDFLGRIYLNGNVVEYFESNLWGAIDFTISVPLEGTPVVELFVLYTNGFTNLGPFEFEGEQFGHLWLGFLDIELTEMPEPEPEPDVPGAVTPNSVYVNGVRLVLDVGPLMVNNHMLLPVRAIGEALGAQFIWMPETRGIRIDLGDETIFMEIGSYEAVIMHGLAIGGETVHTLDTPAIIRNNRALAPLRFIAEIFGADVYWDSTVRSAIITTK